MLKRFVFRLAIHTGWTFDYIMSLEKSLLHELFVFCEYVEPIGPLAEMNRAGQIAATIATVNSKKSYKPSDFFPDLENISINQREAAAKERIRQGHQWLFHGSD